MALHRERHPRPHADVAALIACVCILCAVLYRVIVYAGVDVLQHQPPHAAPTGASGKQAYSSPATRRLIATVNVYDDMRPRPRSLPLEYATRLASDNAGNMVWAFGSLRLIDRRGTSGVAADLRATRPEELGVLSLQFCDLLSATSITNEK